MSPTRTMEPLSAGGPRAGQGTRCGKRLTYSWCPFGAEAAQRAGAPVDVLSLEVGHVALRGAVIQNFGQLYCRWAQVAYIGTLNCGGRNLKVAATG
ncbi:MAG TPA: hypothetical protein VNT26_04615, partial [Candidatus Sulfotelmatobacter sp.]|nr:hypothetical protein [Candidatus Sulfotelmatobacter sp.]